MSDVYEWLDPENGRTLRNSVRIECLRLIFKYGWSIDGVKAIIEGVGLARHLGDVSIDRLDLLLDVLTTARRYEPR